jgi:hypothetical protein
VDAQTGNRQSRRDAFSKEVTTISSVPPRSGAPPGAMMSGTPAGEAEGLAQHYGRAPAAGRGPSVSRSQGIRDTLYIG